MRLKSSELSKGKTRLLCRWCAELAREHRHTWAGLYTSPMGTFLNEKTMEARKESTVSIVNRSLGNEQHYKEKCQRRLLSAKRREQ